MDIVETLQVRPFRQSDRKAAIATYNALVLPDPNEGLREIHLLQDMTLQSDLCIVLRWRPAGMPLGKSRIGVQLASVFAEFGRIDHTLWSNIGTVNHNNV
ncbi:MAG: hypothetical protein KFF50_10585 [Desulfatitalea sp.]|nr:hypothetical protein [Desulfatitalea sp.]